MAAGLRLRGIDVTMTADAGLEGAPDEEQVSHAREQARVVVTHDSDFLRFHAAGVKHAGIVYSPLGARSLGGLIRSLVLIWETLEPQEMANHVEHV
jgi:hypothetical protein